MIQLVHRQVHDFYRTFDLLSYQYHKYPQSLCIVQWQDHIQNMWSIQKLINEVNTLSIRMNQQGWKKGDKILCMPRQGRYEWMLLDLACHQLGIITVPVHPTLKQEELEYIIQETESRLLITADLDLYTAYQEILYIDRYHMDVKQNGYWPWLDIQAITDDELVELEELKALIQEDDLCSILYTSGSTGISKGVMLTHRNIIHNIKSILSILPLSAGQRVFSYLPFSHVFERTTCYAYLAFGVSIYFNSHKDSLSSEFRLIRPHFCTAVPRVLERMYELAENIMLKQGGIEKKVIQWAFKIGSLYDEHQKKKIGYAIKLFLARLLVLNKWKKALGGDLRYMAVGAAALKPTISKLFTAGGITIMEGYGMTEMAPLISINRIDPGLYRLGSVGIAIPGVKIKIEASDEDGQGEILVQGPNRMVGYYKQPELTKAVLTDDGWLRTGDVGYLRENRFLYITDRKKDIFKTSAGKYIAPVPLQRHFESSPFIQQCLILGFQKSFVTALIEPHFDRLQDWCIHHQVHYTSPEYMVHNIKVRELFQREIDRLNLEVVSHEKVRDFVLCHQRWTIESGELTATLKPIRGQIMKHYEKAIEKMYE